MSPLWERVSARETEHAVAQADRGASFASRNRSHTMSPLWERVSARETKHAVAQAYRGACFAGRARSHSSPAAMQTT
jgi:hypothetical protein